MNDRHTHLHALDFLRSCLSSTPLEKFAGAFDSKSLENRRDLRQSIADSLEQFRPDLDRWSLAFEPAEPFFDRLLLAPNLQATYFYRFARALHLNGVEMLPNVVSTMCRLLTGMEIYYSAEIGPGLKVIHGSGSLVGAGCKIGSHFTIYQNVTIGDRLGRETGTGKRPVLGDHVIVAAGAQILGPVKIGSRSIIGANSLVIHSVPEGCISAGIPAKVISVLTDEDEHAYRNAIKG